MSPQSQTATPDRRWIALGVLVAAQFMVVLDVAIVNVALPSIKTDLHFSQESLQWVITAYAIMFGGFLMLGGRLADLLGRRRLFIAGARPLHGELAARRPRVVGGLADRVPRAAGPRGGAALAGRAVDPDDDVRRRAERNIALGDLGRGVGQRRRGRRAARRRCSRAALSWSWIFFINVPVGIVVMALTPFLLRESRADLAHRHFDFAGAASITGGLMLLVYAMTRAAQHGWGTAETIGLLAASARAARGVRRDRDALEGAAPAAADLPAADAVGVERERPADGRGDLLAVLPADALHAAGAALLRDPDRCRLHRR